MNVININLLSTWLAGSWPNSVILSEHLHLLCSTFYLKEVIKPKGEYAKRFSHELSCWVNNPAKSAFGLTESTIRARLNKWDLVRSLNGDRLNLNCEPVKNGSRLHLHSAYTGTQCIISPWDFVVPQRCIWVESEDPGFNYLLEAQVDLGNATCFN